MGEHLPCKQGVMSSNLTISTKIVKRASREPDAAEPGGRLVCQTGYDADGTRMFEEHP